MEYLLLKVRGMALVAPAVLAAVDSAYNCIQKQYLNKQKSMNYNIMFFFVIFKVLMRIDEA